MHVQGQEQWRIQRGNEFLNPPLPRRYIPQHVRKSNVTLAYRISSTQAAGLAPGGTQNTGGSPKSPFVTRGAAEPFKSTHILSTNWQDFLLP